MKKAKQNQKPARRVVVLREQALVEVTGGGDPVVAVTDPSKNGIIVRDWGWWPY